MATVYKIHPAIGVGRVGDSEEYYIAPSQPGGLPTDYSTPNRGGNTFRDVNSKLLRQAAKFQVYAYDSSNPDDPGTLVVPGENGVTITWTVWVANKKSSWFQFEQHTGSGMGPYDSSTSKPGYAFSNDQGYHQNNADNPWVRGNPEGSPTYKDKPANPIRHCITLGLSDDPNSMNYPGRQQLILDPGPQTLTGPNGQANFALDFNTYPFLIRLKPFFITTLGSMLTDNAGDLVVLPGFGNSGTIDYRDDGYPNSPSNPNPIVNAYANNSGWFDDIADGPVEAVVHINGQPIPATGAWFTSAPPKFVPEELNMVTMYDNMHDIFVRELGSNPAIYKNGAFVDSYAPNYLDEVLPILSRPNAYRHLTQMPTLGVTNHAQLLSESTPESFAAAFGYLRGRGEQNGPKGPAENKALLMPLLAGDNPISNFTISKFLGLTQTQFFILSQFAKGIYDKNNPTLKSGPGPQMDKAILENCVGAPFTPGIEITWITRNTSIYMPFNPSAFASSDLYRILGRPIASLTEGKLSLINGSDNNYRTNGGLEPGDLSKYMAQPWQADYNECSTQSINTIAGSMNKPLTANQTLWWWPVQRPYYVFPLEKPQVQVGWTRGFKGKPEDLDDTPTDLQMVTNWKDMGFLKKQMVTPGIPPLQEIERNTDAIERYTPPS